METRRWTNPSQPQTLQIAVFLLYIDAFFLALGGGLFHPILFIFLIATVAAGFGIANEKKWGYILGVVVSGLALLPFAFAIFYDGVGIIFEPRVLLQLVFPVAQFALLVHPQSRDYQRIWFS
jgi:hypothetical protein